MQHDRRQFFLTAAAGSAAVPLVTKATEGQVESETTSAPRLFELGTVTYNLARDWNLEELITNCEQAGFRAVELRTTHKHGVEPALSKAQRAEVRHRFEQTSVKLACLGTACEYHSPEPAVVAENIQLTDRFIELAADVGATGIKVRPNGIPEDVPVETTLRQIGESLRAVGETGEDYGIEIWVEVHGRRSSHPPYIKKMLDYCGHSAVGITWNCNANDLKDGELQPYFDLLKNHIRNVHIHDLFEDYPYGELFERLREMRFDRYTLTEMPGVEGDPIRFMKYYRALWERMASAPAC
jgi:sugar phosphate isomerase/epimerase